LISVNLRSIKEKTIYPNFTNKKGVPPGNSIWAKFMTTTEVSEYPNLHEIAICKYAAQGKIPLFRFALFRDSIKGLMIDESEAFRNLSA
jgi:hypothetical protein